jgi:hypothetical protein
MAEALTYIIRTPTNILLNTFWVTKSFWRNENAHFYPTCRVKVCRRSGKSTHQESDNNLHRFLSRTVVTCKLAWFVSCARFMPPFLTSVTLYAVFLWCILMFLSTYWTHDVRHRDNSSVDQLSSYSCPFAFLFLLPIFSSLLTKFLL